jgi:FAD/FMN-containing dehydrogenase
MTVAAQQQLRQAMQDIVGEKHVYTDEKTVRVFSTDAYTFSPVLTEALKDKLADVIVAPANLDELKAVVRYAITHQLPLTVRGAGTGNYGQSVPLAGGIVILMRRLNTILELDTRNQRVTVEPGVVIGMVERKAREVGLEFPCYPSTWATAMTGGFVGGGFGGIGSIRHGTLYDGNVLGVKVLTAEAEPRELKLGADDAFAVIHAYGVTGIITELTFALKPALPWEESVIAFDDLLSAVRFGYALAHESSIDKRLITMNEWPIPSFFKPLVQDGGVTEGKTGVLLETAEGQQDAVLALAKEFGGALSWQRPASDYHKSRFSLSDFSWNHTTLWAMKADPRYTYLQAQLSSNLEDGLKQLTTLKQRYGDEVLFHMEYIRMGSEVCLSSLPVIDYRDKARLYEIIDTFEAHGVQIADPHTWRLDKDPRWSGDIVVKAKAAWNPTGLLNPGKLGETVI